MELYDVTIIGGGPAGLYGAFYSGLRGMNVQLIEAQPYLGGKLNLYSEKIVWDVGGIPPMPAGAVIRHLIDQAKTFQPTIRTGEKVNGIKKDADGHFLISTTAGHTYLSKTLLLAMGNGILDPKPTPFFTNEGDLLENVHVSITDFEEMKGKRILISGGGNSAVDWANAFAPIAEEVILVYRKEHLKGHEAEVDKVLSGPVTCKLQADLIDKTFDASGSRIDSVTVRDQKTGEEETLSVDDVIVCHGFNRENALFDQNEVGLEVFDEYYVEASPQTETTVPGLFVLGDAAKYPGKVHLIAGAFHDAVNAVNEAKTYIDPQANRMGTVSTYEDKLKSKVSTAWEQYTSK